MCKKAVPHYNFGHTTDCVSRKTLAADNQATEVLQTWAADGVLLRADHFFWLLGTPIQKSVEGLLRGILHSVLLSLSQCVISENAGAIRLVCGPRWLSPSVNNAWSRKELKQMLSRLASLSNVKSFFLVDALDECEPQDRLDDLAKEILWMSQLPNVKLCMSFRPWEVFTRKFTSGIILRLDQLTRRDMEIYIEARLSTAEEEKGWECEFRDRTFTARQFIRSIARSAEGVFLWTELVVTAMCCEIRKGSTVERLSQIISDFPSDLDGYFHRLIFDRIGRSRRNVEDTATALKLALVIYASDQKCGTAFPRSHPFADSYMNFWLLSNGHLRSGFSWMDGKQIVLPPISQMLDQTVGYLEETCKDLLVKKPRERSIGFLHRTVFDFLSDNKLNETLNQNGPSHFSGEDFVFNLARLRCICLLRTIPESCYSLSIALDEILEKYEHLTHMDQHVAWLAEIESVTRAIMREYNYYPSWTRLPANMDLLPSRCMKAGLTEFMLDFHSKMPVLALRANGHGIDLLGVFLHVTNQAETRGPNVPLLLHILELGCDPNRNIGRWPYLWNQRYPFCTDEEITEHSNIMPVWCVRTVWTSWLGEAFLQCTKMRSATSHSDPEEILVERKRHAAVIIVQLLQHGANPHATVCVTDHWKKPYVNCRHITLTQIMEVIVPTEDVTMLRKLYDLCYDQATGYALRRNQRRRAVRSCRISEQFNNRLAKKQGASSAVAWDFLVENLADLGQGDCNSCSRGLAPLLAIWCLNCGGLSTLCYSCFERDPSQLPTLEYSCPGDHGTATESHTSVTFVCEEGIFACNRHEALQGHAKSLVLQYPSSQAISAMKEWYAKDPIEPNLSFEQVLQQQMSLIEQRERASWATLARRLARLSESRPQSLEGIDEAANDLFDDSMD
jgi:hypothetical protein